MKGEELLKYRMFKIEEKTVEYILNECLWINNGDVVGFLSRIMRTKKTHKKSVDAII